MRSGCIVGKNVLSSFIWAVTKFTEDLHAFTFSDYIKKYLTFFFFFRDEIDFLKLETKRNLDYFS